MRQKRVKFLLYFFILGGIICLLGTIFLAPYLKSRSLGLNAIGYAIYSSVCHQIPSRCFSVFGFPLAVCSRCFGVYAGMLAGALLYPFLHGFSTESLPRVRTFILVSLPIAVDTGGNFLHLWETANLPRFFIGLLWGLILPFYLIQGITDFFLGRVKKQTE